MTRAALRGRADRERFFLDADLAAFNVDPMDGPQVDLLNIPAYQPIRPAAEADALLARWRAMPAYLDPAIENLRRGAAEGRIGVATLCTKVTEQLDELLARPDADWPLVEPAEQAPGDPGRAAGGHRRGDPSGVRALSRRGRGRDRSARPTGRSARAVAHARRLGGVRRLARAHTSLDIAARGDPRHRARGDSADRRASSSSSARACSAPKDLDATLQALRKDPALLLHDPRRGRGRWRGRRWRARTPRSASGSAGCRRRPCEVVVMPEHEEKHSTIAYYREPAADGSRPGQFYINTYAPETRPRYEAETLAFHESVPGHHLQIAIMQELTDLPEFRRFNGSTAYIEGWGLYTERLSRGDGPLLGRPRPLRHALSSTPGAPAAWWSTPASTRSAGRGSRRSTSWPRTRRSA